jgi:hypothetical protein
MSNSHINKELESAAVYNEGDLERVKALLSAGADVNLRIGQDKATFLHRTTSVEITKELLLRGAEVDARNMYSETPLHFAIKQGKGLELVRELLKHGAYVNATDRKGNTPLNHAVKKRTKSLKVIEELLQYGANINIKNRERRRFDNYSTSLDNAVGDLECAKLLIKITLIKNFDRDYRKIIDLAPYRELTTYSELSRYLDKCVCEILQMKTDKVNNLSLYEFVITKNTSGKAFHASNKITDQVILTNYPIYHDIISAKAKVGLERASLLNKLSELQVYTKSGISNQDVEEKKVTLNFDSTYNIAKYLSNDDLLNLITAFCKHGQSLDSSENLAELSQQPDTKLDEASTSSCAKRTRLELPCYE